MMRIALLGGTGHIGEGLALRWAYKHDVTIGSRSVEKAEEAATFCAENLLKRGISCEMLGAENTRAVESCEIIVVALQYGYAISTVKSIKNYLGAGQMVLSPVVPMIKNSYMRYTPPLKHGSAAMEIKSIIPDVPVVSAFHTVPAARLIDLNDDLGLDVVVCGDDDPKEVVMELVRDIRGLNPLDGGPLEASYMTESITPLLLNLSARNNLKNASIKIVG
jgi:NADPH-dependent F420 reductase